MNGSHGDGRGSEIQGFRGRFQEVSESPYSRERSEYLAFGRVYLASTNDTRGQIDELETSFGRDGPVARSWMLFFLACHRQRPRLHRDHGVRRAAARPPRPRDALRDSHRLRRGVVPVLRGRVLLRRRHLLLRRVRLPRGRRHRDRRRSPLRPPRSRARSPPSRASRRLHPRPRRPPSQVSQAPSAPGSSWWGVRG